MEHVPGKLFVQVHPSLKEAVKTYSIVVDLANGHLFTMNRDLHKDECIKTLRSYKVENPEKMIEGGVETKLM